jgi:formylglycine-generating enzyme required for sulfatase activity
MALACALLCPDSSIAAAGMVFIPATSFLMGVDRDGVDEHPRHRVTVSAFLLDRNEVTYSQFQGFLLANPTWRKRIPCEFPNNPPWC